MKLITTTLLATLLVATTVEARPKGKTSSKLKEGAPAPGFRLRAPDGAMVRLDEIAYEGHEKKWAKKHPLFLDFFRTDCKPCLKAMPELVTLHEKHIQAGLEIVVIALLEDGKDGRKKLDDYLAKMKLPFKVVIDGNEHIAKKYLGDLVTLPASFLIDRTGKLRKVKYGAEGTYEAHFGDEIAKVISEHRAVAKKK